MMVHRPGRGSILEDSGGLRGLAGVGWAGRADLLLKLLLDVGIVSRTLAAGWIWLSCQIALGLLSFSLGLVVNGGTLEHRHGGRWLTQPNSDMCQQTFAVGSPWPTPGSKDREARNASSSHTAAMQNSWSVIWVG